MSDPEFKRGAPIRQIDFLAAPSAKIARQVAKSKGKKSAKGSAGKVAEVYTHPGQTWLMRPEVGTQAQFRKKKPPQTLRSTR
jgi:hypothetical protein